MDINGGTNMKKYKNTFNYKFNNIDIILNINSKDKINIDNELLDNIKKMIHEDHLFYIEDNSGLTACDTCIYNTAFSMFNIKIMNTYGEHDKILKCEFTFDLCKEDSIKLYDPEEEKRKKLLLQACVY